MYGIRAMGMRSWVRHRRPSWMRYAIDPRRILTPFSHVLAHCVPRGHILISYTRGKCGNGRLLMQAHLDPQKLLLRVCQTVQTAGGLACIRVIGRAEVENQGRPFGKSKAEAERTEIRSDLNTRQSLVRRDGRRG